jgi:protein gp37
MADKSKIEWTDATWNPIRGCSVVSEGCRNCYAMQVAARFSGKDQAYEGLAYRNESGAHWSGQVNLIEQHLEDPIRWKKPRRIFVNSMSDLFHESIPDEWIDRIFAVMAHAQHTFQVLTKRPKRMRDYLSGRLRIQAVCEAWAELQRKAERGNATPVVSLAAMLSERWPLPNVHLGVSIEDQQTADERIPFILETPAAIRFISYEPALGPIRIARYLGCADPDHRHSGPCSLYGSDKRLKWVIVGGESGTGARPCAEEWIESVVRQCQSANVPVFVKQLGAFVVSEGRTAPVEHMMALGYSKPLLKAPNGEAWAWRAGLQNKKGGDPSEWPDRLNVREFPEVQQ